MERCVVLTCDDILLIALRVLLTALSLLFPGPRVMR